MSGQSTKEPPQTPSGGKIFSSIIKEISIAARNGSRRQKRLRTAIAGAKRISAKRPYPKSDQARRVVH